MNFTNTDCVKRKVWRDMDSEVDNLLGLHLNDHLYWKVDREIDDFLEDQTRKIQIKIEQQTKK
jgi:hypothetical protein